MRYPFVTLLFDSPNAKRNFFIRDNQFFFFDEILQQKCCNVKTMVNFCNITALSFERSGRVLCKYLFCFVRYIDHTVRHFFGYHGS